MSLVFEIEEQRYNHLAIIDEQGVFAYQQLDQKSNEISLWLRENGIEKGDRIAFLINPGFDFVSTLFGIWKANAVAVPLCITHPPAELEYVIDDTQSKLLIYSNEFSDTTSHLSSVTRLPFNEIGNLQSNIPNDKLEKESNALILYTSGTTNRPKGVVHTHKSLGATIESLVSAWEWKKEDRILHVLPLHHTHGLVNKLLCAMMAGASVEFLPKFEADIVWNKFEEGKISLFMAVPTIYSKLISYWEEQDTDRQNQLSKACNNLRLMVSGSAALPVPVLDKWEQISGHRLLERYGMTEIGMAISNLYNGERRAGHIGKPLPGVEIKLIDERGEEITIGNSPGEIIVKGDNVFKEYWNKPEATATEFTKDGWFKTGDTAEVNDGYYRILGRNSVDIIKSGGYKISALEIESKLLEHPNILECAVVGIPNEEWGEILAVAIVLNQELQMSNLRDWATDKMAPYKIPRKLLQVVELPRNAMGKVTKKEVKNLFRNS